MTGDRNFLLTSFVAFQNNIMADCSGIEACRLWFSAIRLLVSFI